MTETAMMQIGFAGVYVMAAFVVVTLGFRALDRISVDHLASLWGWGAIPVLALGLYLGLVWAPGDSDMGSVQRIMYVHFPSWVATAATFSVAAVASVLYLLRREPHYDYYAHAGVEVGLVFTATGLITGSIWGRPTWGIWWTWDPRLTATAVMFLAFAGYLALRGFIEDPDRRATFCSVVAAIAFLNLPIVYLSVTWWRTLHQRQSTPNTVDPVFVLPLRMMMVGFLLLSGWLLIRRYQLARLEGDRERGHPDGDLKHE
jgi:heme exporter protein C